jgi:hypothetical protein
VGTAGPAEVEAAAGSVAAPVDAAAEAIGAVEAGDADASPGFFPQAAVQETQAAIAAAIHM